MEFGLVDWIAAGRMRALKPLRGTALGDDIDLRLAGIAHDLWRERMESCGWRHGPYCPKARTHDALVSFDRLNGVDRRAAVLAVLTSGVRESMVSGLDYPRGADRPYSLGEMRPGLPVRCAAQPDRQGSVESWVTDDDGELALIRVRWDDGALTEHPAMERELARP